MCSHKKPKWGCSDCIISRGKLYDSEIDKQISYIQTTCDVLQGMIEDNDNIPDYVSNFLSNALESIDEASEVIVDETKTF